MNAPEACQSNPPGRWANFHAVGRSKHAAGTNAHIDFPAHCLVHKFPLDNYRTFDIHGEGIGDTSMVARGVADGLSKRSALNYWDFNDVDFSQVKLREPLM